MIKKCIECQKDYNVRGKRKEKSKYCSRICKGTNQKKTSGSMRECKHCGNLFYKKGNPKGGEYCTQKCFGASRITSKVVNCRQCGQSVIKHICNINKSKDVFCNIDCANEYQGRNKVSLICQICKKEYRISPVKTKRVNKYCSIKCRNQDKEHLLQASIKGNLAQLNKKGLNKLELKGREILTQLGIEYQEQVLMFEKFLVDVLVEGSKLVIQWDGEYWHTKPKRKRLDESQDKYMAKCGYKVLRITDRQIKENIEGVYENIKKAI